MDISQHSQHDTITSSPPPLRGPSKKKRQLVALGVLLGVAVIGLCTYLALTANLQTTDDAQIEADVVPLAVRTGGLVLRVMVSENQSVKAGDVIMELDQNDQLARVQQAEAELATAKAQTAAAEAQASVIEASARGGLQSAKAMVSGSSVAVAAANAQIIAARAGIERSKAEARKTQIDLERAKTLRAANAVTQEHLDNAQATFDSMTAQSEQANALYQASLESKAAAESHVLEAQGHLGQSTPIEAQIAAAHAAVDLAHAGVQAAQARLDLQRLQFSYLKVTAPVSGTMSRISAHEGQLLQAGQAIGELVPVHTYVVANFKETQVARIKKGQRATVKVDALAGRELHGVVHSLSGGTGARFALLPPDNASGNFVKVVQRVPVRIDWDNLPSDVLLRAGLSADVTVDTKE